MGGNRNAGSNGMSCEPLPRTVNRFAPTVPLSHPRPTKVFYSRELEEGLMGLVKHRAECGRFPSNEELWERGRAILGTSRTLVEEPALLDKFKRMAEEELGLSWKEPAGKQGMMASPAAAAAGVGVGPGVAMSGSGTTATAFEGGIPIGEDMGAMSGFGGLEGLDAGMDLSADMDSALMQDLNFDFVFDTQDATMGGGMG